MKSILNHAAGYKGHLSNAALQTFAGIAASIEQSGSMSQWDKANSHMHASLLKAKISSKTKAAFLKAAKQETGIAKNSHPLLVWCVAHWY